MSLPSPKDSNVLRPHSGEVHSQSGSLSGGDRVSSQLISLGRLNTDQLPELKTLQNITLEQLESTTQKLEQFNVSSTEQYKRQAQDFKASVKKLKDARQDLDQIFRLLQ
jgi:hypothetical protein